MGRSVRSREERIAKEGPKSQPRSRLNAGTVGTRWEAGWRLPSKTWHGSARPSPGAQITGNHRQWLTGLVGKLRRSQMCVVFWWSKTERATRAPPARWWAKLPLFLFCLLSWRWRPSNGNVRDTPGPRPDALTYLHVWERRCSPFRCREPTLRTACFLSPLAHVMVGRGARRGGHRVCLYFQQDARIFSNYIPSIRIQ